MDKEEIKRGKEAGVKMLRRKKNNKKKVPKRPGELR